MAQTKPRILTGDTPTHTGLHLGHWVGSLENRVRLQDEYDCYFLLANMHAFTTLADKPADIRANTIGIVKDWLAAGIDPERSTIVLQTEVPAIAELSWFFAMLLPFNKVMRNPTLKTEIETKGLGDSYSFGFPMYAVGQCADILAFRPELVPVGEDQEAHIEMCRDVAGKFNQMYCGVGNRVPPEEHVKAGGVFPIPRAKIGRVARLVGTDGVNKMSKSLGNAIFLTDSPKEIQKKINRITTGRQSPTEPGKPDNVLMQYVDAFIPADRAAEIKRRYTTGDNIGDGHVKAELGEAIAALIEPMRERRAKLDEPGGDDIALDVIRTGTARANRVAEETLYMAKQAMKLDFGSRSLRAGG
ncbi:MAG: tryptophan--tRNA ligase [Phycisphaeraceae bacterium]|nr:tryptophan--tRNA ligase [Phycisphaeraceae bacterium]